VILLQQRVPDRQFSVQQQLPEMRDQQLRERLQRQKLQQQRRKQHGQPLL
jgi:hypothetical protein